MNLASDFVELNSYSNWAIDIEKTRASFALQVCFEHQLVQSNRTGIAASFWNRTWLDPNRPNLSLLLVLVKMWPTKIRAYAQLQKIAQIGYTLQPGESYIRVYKVNT